MSKTNGKGGQLLVIRANGNRETLHFVPGQRPLLSSMQALVGGDIEQIAVRVDGKVREAYVDEEGRRKNLPFNAAASELSCNGHRICGTMIVWIP